MKTLIIFVFVFAVSFVSVSRAAEDDKGFFGFFKKESKDAPAAGAAVAPVKEPGLKASVKDKSKAPAAGAADRNASALQNRMANNKSMTDAEKGQLVSAALTHLPADADVTSKEYEADALRFEQVVNDPNMKVAEKKAEIQKHFSQLGTAAKKGAPAKKKAEVVAEAAPAAVEEAAPIPVTEVKPPAVPEVIAAPEAKEEPKKEKAQIQEAKKEAVEVKEEAKTEFKEEVKKSSGFARKAKDRS